MKKKIVRIPEMYAEVEVVEWEAPVEAMPEAVKEQEPEKPLSYDDFRKKVFQDATELIQDRWCSTFKLMGYKHLNIRLILYFDDCNEVFDYTNYHGVYQKTKFFTKDHLHTPNRLVNIRQFKREMERDVPEGGSNVL
jgi:hypothetical protein